MNRKLYVGNLAYAATIEELKEAFAKFGAIREVKIVNGPDGRSKGFGFIEFENADDAIDAINGMNEQEFKGRKLVVDHARPKTTPA